MTPRTIKASEVRKGMRVRVEREHPKSGPRLAYTVTFEGVVSEATDTRFTIVGDGPNDYTFWADETYPTIVTVLAEPEPALVEGAWYWVEIYGPARPMYRTAGGWSISPDDKQWWRDGDGDRTTVLGRFVAVDYPGDEDATAIVETHSGNFHWLDAPDRAAQALANAIVAQGGVA